MDYLATASPLDGLLDGGLECDAITLVFGEGGSGKTNLALQCAREVAVKGKRIAYVDTEGVSSVRLRQVFAGHAIPLPPTTPSSTSEAHGDDSLPPILTADQLLHEHGAPRTTAEPPPATTPLSTSPSATGPLPSLEPIEDLMARVLFFTPYTIEEQEKLVQNATRVPDLGLLVVDSINMHYRLHIDTGGDAEAEASRSLYKQLHHLTGFARQNNVPILVTGQVYGGEDTTQPFARRTMEHLVKALIRFEKRLDGSRRATVIKHRSIEEGRMARFRIGQTGLEEA